MAAGIDGVLGRINFLVEGGNGLSSQRRGKVLNRLDRLESRIGDQESKIGSKLAKLDAKIQKFEDQDPDKHQRLANLVALRDKFDERLAKIEAQRSQIEDLRARLAEVPEPGEGPIQPGDGPVVIGDDDEDDDGPSTNDPVQLQFSQRRFGASKLDLAQANRRAMSLHDEASYYNKSEELLEDQIKTATELRSALRSGDKEKINEKQEELYEQLESQLKLDNQRRVARGGQAEDLEIDKDVFTTVNGITDFISEKRDEVRGIADERNKVEKALQSVERDMQGAKLELTKLSKARALDTLEAARKTAEDLKSEIINSAGTAMGAHEGLSAESARLLLE